MQGSMDESMKRQEGLLFDGSPFLVTAAHELKAPLALIRQLSLTLEVGTSMDTQERGRILRQISLTSERALRLTTDLSRSSRLEGSFFEVEPLNPQQLCEEAAHELAPLYKAHGREIRVAAHNRSMLVVANRDLLRRIILNFGDNALHYADDSAPVELQSRAFLSGKKVRISVRDHGPAVPLDIWRRLSNDLGTNTQVLHARPQSSGLGLYVAAQFATAMQGTIGATRHRDGATFFVDMDASTQLSLL
jgi:K+-sensing histidine kinase KdpD